MAATPQTVTTIAFSLSFLFFFSPLSHLSFPMFAREYAMNGELAQGRWLPMRLSSPSSSLSLIFSPLSSFLFSFTFPLSHTSSGEDAMVS
jgi:hypothetical protein